MEPVPFSALELCVEHQHGVPAVKKRTRFPWWLSPLVLTGLLLVLAYRTFVPVSRRRRCIYAPSCSQYALDCLRAYGFFRGVTYIVQRLQRCNGARFRGGFDPA